MQKRKRISVDRLVDHLTDVLFEADWESPSDFGDEMAGRGYSVAELADRGHALGERMRAAARDAEVDFEGMPREVDARPEANDESRATKDANAVERFQRGEHENRGYGNEADLRNFVEDPTAWRRKGER